MHEIPEDKFSDEIEDRLETLFGEEEPVEVSEHGSGAAKDYPLRDLKSIVLSIDWEINEEVMAGFVDQVGILQDRYREDKVVLVFLQLLGSLGDYIRKNLGKSHPEAFRILNSMFGGLEKIVQAEDMADNEKKRILSAELNKYKQLKSELAGVQATAVAKKPADGATPAAPVDSVPADMTRAIEDLKQFVRKELEALKEEIKKLRRDLAGRGTRPEE